VCPPDLAPPDLAGAQDMAVADLAVEPDLAMHVAADLARVDMTEPEGQDGGKPGVGREVDVLFMVDNSPSMDAMQTMLKAQFSSFIDELVSLPLPLDLHIGVVTSDYGAGAVDSIAAGCEKSPGGQRGLLQTTAAVGTPQAGCKGPVGAPYISYVVDAGGTVTTNLPGGATDTASVASTFTCIASVGSNGCGFEHQLESVYAALHNSNENAGFLRPGAQLVVVFLTNEDDGSAPPTTDVFNPDPAKQVAPPAGYGAYDTYRQTDFGVACMIGGVLKLTPYGDSGGPLLGCEAAPNDNSVMLGSEYDVSRYIDLFTKSKAQGGLKDDPSRILLAALDAPDSSVQIIQVAVGTGNGKGAYPNPAAYQPCPAPNTVDGKSCLVRVQHSCQNTLQPGFFGDPAVRLNTVVNAVTPSQVTSICGSNLDQMPDYSGWLKALGATIKSRLK
jgi:hypothetical protein